MIDINLVDREAYGVKFTLNAGCENSVSSTTGDCSSSSAIGDGSVSSTTGYNSVSSTTGDCSVSSAIGHRSASSASGYASAAVSTGIGARGMAGKFGVIALAWWNESKMRCEMRCAETGCGDGSDGKLKAFVWYRLNLSGEFAEIS